MRLFYIFKLLQIVLTAVVLISVFSTNEICSSFILNKVVIRQILNNVTCKQLKTQMDLANIGVGAIVDSNGLELGKRSRTRMGKFFSDVLQSWDKAWGYDSDIEKVSSDNEKSEIIVKKKLDDFSTKSSDLNIVAKIEKQKPRVNKRVELKPTSENVGFRQCAKVYLQDLVSHNKDQNSIGFVLQAFAIPILLTLCYFIFLFFHVILRNPLPYGCFTITLLILSVLSWLYVFLRMINLEYRWDEYFLSTNIRPELMSSIVIFQVISIIIIIMSFFEIAYNNVLMRSIRIKNGDDSSSSSLNGEVTYYDPNMVESSDQWKTY